MPFFLIFVGIPFLEIIGFMTVGEKIGLFPTLLLAFGTAIFGGYLVRHQGLQTFLSFRQTTARGALPSDEIFTGFCLIAAGALLITPGFLTDTIGFSLLVPAFRKVLKTFLSTKFKWDTSHYTYGPYTSHTTSILDGEFETVDPDNDER